jgi:hypothetical protein
MQAGQLRICYKDFKEAQQFYQAFFGNNPLLTALKPHCIIKKQEILP